MRNAEFTNKIAYKYYSHPLLDIRQSYRLTNFGT